MATESSNINGFIRNYVVCSTVHDEKTFELFSIVRTGIIREITGSILVLDDGERLTPLDLGMHIPIEWIRTGKKVTVTMQLEEK